MALQLRYKAKTQIPVEIEGITPDVVRALSVAEIERLDAYHGNEQLPLADLFDISGNPEDQRMHFEGDVSGVHWIGAKMAAGEIHVEGDAGRHVGSEMSGGRITVTGDAGDWVGGEMHGGEIEVRGRAGHLIGSAYRGSERGMTGGIIRIHGDVGNEIGHTMRRGFIAVGGACGDFVGVNMIAGSVLVLGESGIRPGPGMRRGTIALLGPNPPQLLPTFRRGCRIRPNFLRYMFLELARSGFPVATEHVDRLYRMYHGDALTVGKGEILLRAEDS